MESEFSATAYKLLMPYVKVYIFSEMPLGLCL